MPPDLQPVFDWLASAREPRSTQELWDEMTLHGSRTPPDGLPTTVGRLANAMLDLCLKGYVVEREGRWHLAERPVEKRERMLF